MNARPPTIVELLPLLRLQAREWTASSEQADDVVARALELAIEAAPDFIGDDIEGWLQAFLLKARSQVRTGRLEMPFEDV